MTSHKHSFIDVSARNYCRRPSKFSTTGKRSCPTMESEYSILTNIAANLSIYHLNRDSSAIATSTINSTRRNIKPVTGNSVHEEAELLMSFMTATAPESADTVGNKKIAKPSKKIETPKRRPSSISPSFSFEAKKFEKLTARKDTRNVIHAPTRSGTTPELQPEHQSEHDFKQCSSDDRDFLTFSCPGLSLNQDPNVSSFTVSSNPTPSYLFSRPITTKAIDIYSIALGDTADSLANNVIESFNAAMKWQTKTWIKALSRVLSSRYEINKMKLAKTGSKHKGIDSIKDELRKCNEARVINSLSKASSAVFVHDVRTTFSVLEQQLDNKDNSSLKRMKLESGLIHSTASRTPYNLSHAITLDTRFSVSTSPMKKISVSFKTPGAINGTFVRDSDGNAQLKEASISLDTEALASAMDENCRRIMRCASSEFMISPPMNYCTIYDTVQEEAMAEDKPSCDDSHCTPEPLEESASKQKSVERRYESYFYSPTIDVETSCPLVTPTLSSFKDVSLAFRTRLPSQKVLVEGKVSSKFKAAFLNPRRVSPTEQCVGSGPFDSPTPTKDTFLTTSKAFTTNLVPPPPSLVSPYNPNIDQIEAENAPTMPALLEVARAAHAKCH